MMQDIQAAIPLGFLLSFMIGPVFFVLLETSAVKGFRAAFVFDLGVILADILFLVVDYFSSFQLLENLSNQPGLYVLVKRNTEEGRLTFTTDLTDGIAQALFVFNCVGTPPRADGSCDLSYVRNVGQKIGNVLEEYKAAMLYSADFASGRYNLGNLWNSLGQTDRAIEEYTAALRIDDRFLVHGLATDPAHAPHAEKNNHNHQNDD